LLTADLATGLTTALTKDGQTTPTANIPMGSFKITGLGAGTSATDAAQYGQLQAGATTIATVTGTDTLTGSVMPALTAYATGNLFSFVAASTNTGAATINLNSLGAKSITKQGTTVLIAGDIASGRVHLIEYDGTRFQLLNPASSTGTGAQVFATSPTLVTPDLGTPSSLVGTNITGTAAGLTAGSVTTNANLTGAVTSVGNATSLGSFTSANLLAALTDETGTGANVFATSPTLVTPILGTPTSVTLTNGTGLPLTTGVTGNLPVTNLNSGTSASSSTYWRGDGTWAAAGATPAGSTTQVQYNNAGAFGGITGATTNGTALTLTGAILNGTIGATTPSTGAFTTGAFGTTPATTGVIRIPNASPIYARNASNSADRHVIEFNSSGEVAINGDGNNTVIGTTVGTLKTATTISVGAATPSSSGAGITFPATQSASSDANTLDDYEEGTWTPNDASGASLSFTINGTSRYVKIGQQVTLITSLTYPSTANTSAATIGGLPFSAISGTVGGGALGYTGGLPILIYGTGGTLRVYRSDSTSNSTNAYLSTKELTFTITYFV
jgi:hypothetical protein